MICLFDVGPFYAVVRHKGLCSGPIKTPSLLALWALHLIIGDPLAAGDLPSVQDLELANREVFSWVVPLLLTADRDPNVVVLEIPHADLYWDSVAADNFEEFPVVLVAVFSIEVDHGISGAKCKYLVLFVKSDTEDVGRARVGQRYLFLYPGGLTGLVGDAGDSLVGHGCYQFDWSGSLLECDKGVRRMVQNCSDYWAVPHYVVFEVATQSVLLENVRPGHLKHVVCVQVIWCRLFNFQQMVGQYVFVRKFFCCKLCVDLVQLLLIDRFN